MNRREKRPSVVIGDREKKALPSDMNKTTQKLNRKKQDITSEAHGLAYRTKEMENDCICMLRSLARPIHILVEPKDTIGCIKAKIEHKTGIPSKKLGRFFFSGKEWKDNRSLCDYNIKKKSMLHFVLRSVCCNTNGDKTQKFREKIELQNGVLNVATDVKKIKGVWHVEQPFMLANNHVVQNRTWGDISRISVKRETNKTKENLGTNQGPKGIIGVEGQCCGDDTVTMFASFFFPFSCLYIFFHLCTVW
jgi:hypothetical protein